MKEGTATGQIVDPIHVALTFPEFPQREIGRDYLLDTIDEIFEAGIEVVFLDGNEQIGKSILAAQFCRRHAKRAFCLFVREFSDLATDISQIRYDLGNQVQWYLRGKLFEPDKDVPLETLRSLLLLLHRKIHQERSVAFFILDGIKELCNSRPSFADFIFSTLPIGMPGFRFLISGPPDQVPAHVRKNLGARTQRISHFTTTEAQNFLSDLGLSSAVVDDIYSTTRGIPGHLSTVRRLLESGREVDELFDSPEASLDLFEPEWQRIDIDNALQLDAVAALAFLPECRDKNQLAATLAVKKEELSRALAGLTFLVESDGRIGFVSDSFQRYARKRLQSKEAAILEAAIRRLREEPDAVEALLLLPDYLQRAGRLSDLGGYLDSARIATAARVFHSMGEVNRRLALLQQKVGVGSEDGLGVRCAITRPVLAELMFSESTGDRIEAELAVRRDGEALALANTSEVDEQRLQLLAKVARSRRARGLTADPSVVDEIRKLVASIDFGSLGDRVVELAADLALVAPDLTTKAMEAYAKDQDDPNRLDQAIVRLSLLALRSVQDETDLTRVYEQVDKLVGSDQTHSFARTGALVFETKDTAAVLKQLEGFKNTSERMFYTRRWLQANAKEQAAPEVALGASKWLLADTAYAPNATIFRDLSLPLSSAPLSEAARKLLSFIDGQSQVVQERGPVVDFYRMRFHAAIARINWDDPDAFEVLEDDALSIVEIGDLAVRAACYAWLVRCLHDAKVGGKRQQNGVIDVARRAAPASQCRRSAPSRASA